MDDLKTTLSDLQDKHEQAQEYVRSLEEAIAVLEKLSGGGNGKRRKGRSASRAPTWTAASRKAAALRMKKYWADRKKKSERPEASA